MLGTHIGDLLWRFVASTQQKKTVSMATRIAIKDVEVTWQARLNDTTYKDVADDHVVDGFNLHDDDDGDFDDDDDDDG